MQATVRAPKQPQDHLQKISHRLKEASDLTGASEDALRKMIASDQLKAKRINPSGNGQRYMTMIPHSELVRVFGIA